MGVAENKRAIEDYFAKVAAGSPELAALLTDDVTWWVPPSSPLAGSHVGRDAVLGLMGQGVDLYDPTAAMRFEIEQMVAEGDTVCVQLVLRARTAAGADYENFYHFVFRLRAGRICAVKEYVDTLTAQRLLFDPAGPRS